MESHIKRKKLYLDPIYDRRMLSTATRRKLNKIRDVVLPRINTNKEGNSSLCTDFLRLYTKTLADINPLRDTLICLFFLSYYSCHGAFILQLVKLKLKLKFKPNDSLINIIIFLLM